MKILTGNFILSFAAGIFLCLCPIKSIKAGPDEITQTIRGKIIDKQSQMTLPGVNVVLLSTDPILGTASDIDGKFKIEGVPVGRHILKVSFLGYEDIILSNLDVTSGKQVVLNLEMEESVVTVEEVVVSANGKASALNQLSTLSTRTFSVEESNRFAGSLNDVSRMATNFAGVRSANDAVNDIVIRGNSPMGLLWRLDGVDIPNPNHFGDGGATGGPVSMLNNNVLANSDFMTGAFPAEYGNALSGVFDLRMRNGNNEKNEFLGQVGFNGFEAGAEGPISRKKGSSFLINYRYSTLQVLKNLGVDFGTGTSTPYYQDLTGKLNFPTKRSGTFSLTALGGISSIDFLDSQKDSSDSDGFYDMSDTDIRNRNKLGIIAFTHKYQIGNNAYSKFTLSASYTKNSNIVDSISTENKRIIPWYRSNYQRRHYNASFFVNKKFSAKHNARIGIICKIKEFDMVDSAWLEEDKIFRTLTDFNGNTIVLQPYVQWQYKINDKITLNTGLHSQYIQYNTKYSIEPRLGLKYKFHPNHTVSIAYGYHSMAAPLLLLESQVRLDDGSQITPNTNLGFTFSHHYVAGYDYTINSTTRFKAELYYQQIDDAIVEEKPSAYSYLNAGSFTFGSADYLTNDGSGKNYGAELTFEKFLDKGFYYLATASIFESKYKGSDGVERNTAFNGRYVFNVLGGKEFNLTKKPNKKPQLLTIDMKYNQAGGQRYTPINVEKSEQKNETVYIEERSYEKQLEDYIHLDLRIGFKMISKRLTQEWAIDMQNLTNRKNPLAMSYNQETQKIEKQYQTGFFPMMLYRVTF